MSSSGASRRISDSAARRRAARSAAIMHLATWLGPLRSLAVRNQIAPPESCAFSGLLKAKEGANTRFDGFAGACCERSTTSAGHADTCPIVLISCLRYCCGIPAFVRHSKCCDTVPAPRCYPNMATAIGYPLITHRLGKSADCPKPGLTTTVANRTCNVSSSLTPWLL